MDSIFIKGYYGFGDNIWMFPFVKEACRKFNKVYLQTYFPFLFDTLPNIIFVKPPHSTLKACTESIKKYPPEFWTGKPTDIPEIRFPYYLTGMRHSKNLVQSFNEGIPILSEKIDFSLPIKPEWIRQAKAILDQFDGKKKICLIKPPSDRTDWKNSARIPKPRYFQHLVNKYRKDYYFITIANTDVDIYMKELRHIDLKFEKGELDLTTIIGLSSLADMIITYNCFFFPLGTATKTKTFVINGGYTDPNMYVDHHRMDLSHVRIITPTPCCTCVDRNHECEKYIPIKEIDQAFEDLKESNPTSQTETYITKPRSKKNMLISRMRAERCHKIATNPAIATEFNIYTVDHTSSGYSKYKNEFQASYTFPSVGNVCRPQLNERKEIEIENLCRHILTENKIELVLNAQPLHPYNTIMAKICKELKIRCINTETFCDDKWLFDEIGCQYVCPNEIYRFIDKININSNIPIDLPRSTRQPQPPMITQQQFFKKYNLSPAAKYIVLLGQLMWDMSVKKSVNVNIQTYEQYIDLVLRSNPDITFIVKNHPIYLSTGKYNEVRFIKQYPNVVIVNESIDTLFSVFDYFTSFSSTTVFEGIIHGKKFATMGFHFCNTDQLVLQLRSNKTATKLYNRLVKLQLSSKAKERYLRFVCNYYTIDLSSPKLYNRLILTPDEYYRQNY